MASTKKMNDLDPQLYSSECNDEGFLVPKIVDGGTDPKDFLFPFHLQDKQSGMLAIFVDENNVIIQTIQTIRKL